MVGAGSHYSEGKPPPLASLKFGEIPSKLQDRERRHVNRTIKLLTNFTLYTSID